MIDILRNNLKLAEISYKRADWANFRECDDIVKGGEVIWEYTPYDAATTAYLMATYSAYWNEIRAFGKSHPNLVPFVNEDNDLIVSLVEVGKVRLAVSNGSGYFVTDYIPNQDTTLYVEYRGYTQGARQGFFGAPSSSTEYCYGLYNGTSATWDNYNDDTSIGGFPASGTLAILKDKNKLYFNGVLKRTAGTPTFRANRSLALMMQQMTNGSANYIMYSGTKILTCYIEENGERLRTYAPFKRNGQMELLDIVTGTLATRVGTFTELIE